MAIERTFSIIKPDATTRNLTGAINAMIEQAGLRIVAQRRVRMTREQAETFYAVHRQRPFFGELVETMTSDRKSTRLNSSHMSISYAVFCLKKKKKKKKMTRQ